MKKDVMLSVWSVAMEENRLEMEGNGSVGECILLLVYMFSRKMGVISRLYI